MIYGRGKELDIIAQKTPWLVSDNLNGKYVCCDCIQDSYLRKIIKKNLKNDECFYCKKKSKNLIAASLREIIQAIYEGICSEWQEPIDIIGCCLPKYKTPDYVFNIFDFNSYLAEEAGIDNSHIISDISWELEGCQWFKYHLRFYEKMLISWDYFSELVKHNFRYTFFNVVEKKYFDNKSGSVESESESITLIEFFKTLNHVIKNNKKMIANLKRGEKVYRARLFENKEDIKYTADQLGAPPKEIAETNRMSPKGVSLFYCALDKKTALEEVIIRKKSGQKYIVIAEFLVLRDIDVLNLYDDFSHVSLFDPNKRWERQVEQFLKEFAREISKEVSLNDDKFHLEYVPTQVITEYFRYIFKHKKSESLSGIVYCSARNKGKNCALFIDNAYCRDVTTMDNKEAIVHLNSHELIML